MLICAYKFSKFQSTLEFNNISYELWEKLLDLKKRATEMGSSLFTSSMQGMRERGYGRRGRTWLHSGPPPRSVLENYPLLVGYYGNLPSPLLLKQTATEWAKEGRGSQGERRRPFLEPMFSFPSPHVWPVSNDWSDSELCVHTAACLWPDDAFKQTLLSSLEFCNIGLSYMLIIAMHFH